jgi:hypothetical protein
VQQMPRDLSRKEDETRTHVAIGGSTAPCSIWANRIEVQSASLRLRI